MLYFAIRRELEDLKNAQAQAQAQAQAVASSRLDSHYMDFYRMRYVTKSQRKKIFDSFLCMKFFNAIGF